MKIFLKKILKNKEVSNAGWLIGGKIIQMIMTLVVGIISARYLGPSNYGLVSYGHAYVNFFMSLCTLGINAVIIKDFFDHPDEQGLALGSSIGYRLISSFLSAILIVSVSFVLDFKEPTTILVVALCSISLLFHCLDTFRYWFQSQYKSKYTAMATFIAYTITSAYKIVLLILNKSVIWFALATSVDYLALGFILYIVYKKNGGPRLSFSWKKGRDILSKSYHYILAGMMVAIYGQTDKLMLKQMLDSEAVGFYSTATAICTMWVFVLSAIIDSIYPTIIQLFKTDKERFECKNRQLYAIVFYVSCFVSVIFTFFGGFFVKILYGDAYAGATLPLKIVTWYTAFSYLGVARNAWIVCNNMQKYLKYMYIGAAVINVGLNLLLIPKFGASGAATASLITQIFTSIILPFFFKGVRPNAKLMLEAIFLRKLRAKGTSSNESSSN